MTIYAIEAANPDRTAKELWTIFPQFLSPSHGADHGRADQILAAVESSYPGLGKATAVDQKKIGLRMIEEAKSIESKPQSN